MTLFRSLIKNCSTKKHFWLEQKYHKLLTDSCNNVGSLLKHANNLEEVVFIERRLNFLSKLKQEEKDFHNAVGQIVDSFNSHLSSTCIAEFHHTELIHSFLMSLQSSDEKSMILVDIGQIMRFYDDLYEKDYRFWPSKSRVKFLLNYLFTLDLWLGTQLSFVPEEDINEIHTYSYSKCTLE